MPGRMELDLVDPVAVTVMALEFGGVAIGEESPPIDLRRSDPSTEICDQIDRPTSVVTL